MRIEVTRTGGFAGITRSATLETAGRPDAAHLESLAHTVIAAPPPAGLPRVPDGFHYEITAAGRTIACADPHLTPAQRELVRAVLAEGA